MCHSGTLEVEGINVYLCHCSWCMSMLGHGNWCYPQYFFLSNNNGRLFSNIAYNWLTSVLSANQMASSNVIECAPTLFVQHSSVMTRSPFAQKGTIDARSMLRVQGQIMWYMQCCIMLDRVIKSPCVLLRIPPVVLAIFIELLETEWICLTGRNEDNIRLFTNFLKQNTWFCLVLLNNTYDKNTCFHNDVYRISDIDFMEAFSSSTH